MKTNNQIVPSSLLLATARQIINSTPGAILTGSLALHLRDIRTRRTPVDLDILLPPGGTLIVKLLPGYSLRSLETQISTAPDAEHSLEYADPDFSRTVYELTDNNGSTLKIDAHVAETAEGYTYRRRRSDFLNGLLVNSVSDIVASKAHYALQKDTRVATKHLLDIFFILNQS